MKIVSGILGLVLAAVFLVLAISTTVPDTYISSWGSNKMMEYVGGDAYNYIIEASLRGGEIAGAQITKAIYFAVAALLAVISVSFFSGSKRHEQPAGTASENQKMTDVVHEACENSHTTEMNAQVLPTGQDGNTPAES